MWRISGFTLIELLISIGVVAVLSAGVIGIIGQGPRQFARDTRRQADLQTFASAIELYRNDNATYPACSGPAAATCQALSTRMGVLVPDYLNSTNWPADPSGASRYYRYSPVNAAGGQCDGTVGNPCVRYTVCAGSEKDTTTNNNASCGGSGCGTSAFCVFVVSNP